MKRLTGTVERFSPDWIRMIPRWLARGIWTAIEDGIEGGEHAGTREQKRRRSQIDREYSETATEGLHTHATMHSSDAMSGEEIELRRSLNYRARAWRLLLLNMPTEMFYPLRTDQMFRWPESEEMYRESIYQPSEREIVEGIIGGRRVRAVTNRGLEGIQRQSKKVGPIRRALPG